MSSETRSLHGIRIGVSIEGAARDVCIEELLPFIAELPVAEPSTGDPDILLRFLPGAPEPGELERISRAPPLFFHGSTRGFADEAATVLTDGHSWVRASRDGRLIEAAIDRRSLDDGYTLANTTLFIALMLALRSHGLFHLHAGGLVSPAGKPLLIAGEGGTGKTTSTLALIASGWDYLGDDAVLIAERAKEIAVLQIPKPFHVDERSLAPFPEYREFLGTLYRENRDKRAFDARAAFPGRARACFGQPAILLFTEIAGRPETELEPISQGEALGELTRSGALVMIDGIPGVAEQLALFRRLVAGARAFRAHLGRDLLTTRRALDLALERAMTMRDRPSEQRAR